MRSVQIWKTIFLTDSCFVMDLVQMNSNYEKGTIYSFSIETHSSPPFLIIYGCQFVQNILFGTEYYCSSLKNVYLDSPCIAYSDLHDSQNSFFNQAIPLSFLSIESISSNIEAHLTFIVRIHSKVGPSRPYLKATSNVFLRVAQTSFSFWASLSSFAFS